MKLMNSFRFREITRRMFFSYGLFLLFMFLDFFTTGLIAKENISMEGNVIAVIWWIIMGSLRHVDIPVWMVYVFVIGYLLNLKKEFWALWWFNGLAFGHIFGWLSWSQNIVIDSFYDWLYSSIRNDLVLTAVLSLSGMLLGLLFTFLQVKLYVDDQAG